MNDNNEGKVCKSDEKNEEENDDDENLVQSKISFVGRTDELYFSQPSTSHGVLKEEQIISQASTSHTWPTDESCPFQSNTFCAGHKDEPKWNTSTRQLYEFNLKSSSRETRGAGCYKSSDFQARLRLASITDSVSSDDSCVYMYKGEDGQRNGNNVNKPINSSSPEMDYLEMDFDPCQSNGQDSSDGSYSCDIVDIQDEERAASSNSRLNPSESNEDERNLTPTCTSSSPVCFLESNIALVDPLQLIDSNESLNQQEDEYRLQPTEASHIPQTPELNNESETPEQSNESQPLQIPTTESDITCSEQNVLLKKHINGTTSQYFKKFENVPCCITTISQAVNKLISEEIVIEDVKEEGSNQEILIPELLYKLSNGYLTISRVQEIIGKATNGAVLAKYFEANSSMLLNLSIWLNYWLKKDAVAVVSLNFHIREKNNTNVVHSSWHYSLIHGVNPNGIQIFSPSETISEETLKKLFLNPSESLIRKDCIMAHWTPTTNFKPLLHHPDNSWKEYNVLGQIVNTVRVTLKGYGDEEIGYIKVPSPHKSGILLMMHSDNVNLNNLVEADATFSPL